MTVQKRQRLMFVVLIASVIFGLVMKPWDRPRPNADVPEQSPALTVEAPSAQAATPDVSMAALVSDWPERDPFRAPSVVVASVSTQTIESVSLGSPTFVLQGIMGVGGNVACVIDGNSQYVGSVVSGWRIDKIESQGVWVSQGGERQYVPLR